MLAAGPPLDAEVLVAIEGFAVALFGAEAVAGAELDPAGPLSSHPDEKQAARASEARIGRAVIMTAVERALHIASGMCTLTSVSSLAALALILDAAVASDALAREPDDRCDPAEGDESVDVAPPPRRAVEPIQGGSRYRAPGLLAGGIVTTVVGIIPAAVGIPLIVDDQSSHSDWLDGLGTTFGGILLGVSAVHLAVGIPLIVVGSEKNLGDERPAKTTVTMEARANGANLTVTF